MTHSISPDGEKFPLPTEEQYAEEYKRLERLVNEQRKQGREIVVRQEPDLPQRSRP